MRPTEDHSLDALASRTAERFAERFGRRPRWIAAAPGRVNLIGEHVDYNGGFVLPMAIERYTVIAAAPTERGTVPFCSATGKAPVPATKGDSPRRVADVATSRSSQVHLASADLHEETSFTLDGKLAPGKPAWANYVRGVLAGCIQRGFAIPGFDALISSNVPIGGGLSSSAALEVAVATLAEAITGQTIEPTAKALLCQMAEHEFAGVPCGIMDQFIAVGAKQGYAMLLDCRSMQSELIPFADPGVTVLIINSQVRHSLATGEYAKRRAECHAAVEALRVAALRDVTIDDLNHYRAELDPTVFRRAGTLSARLSAPRPRPVPSHTTIGPRSEPRCMPATRRCVMITT